LVLEAQEIILQRVTVHLQFFLQLHQPAVAQAAQLVFMVDLVAQVAEAE
jgi:hypothetical protein